MDEKTSLLEQLHINRGEEVHVPRQSLGQSLPGASASGAPADATRAASGASEETGAGSTAAGFTMRDARILPEMGARVSFLGKAGEES